MKLGDVVVRDPFKKPVEFQMQEAFTAAMRKLLGPKAREKMLVLNRATRPMNVIGSTLGASCEVCGEGCWCAPSSGPLVGTPGVVVVCLPCVLAELAKLAATGRID